MSPRFRPSGATSLTTARRGATRTLTWRVASYDRCPSCLQNRPTNKEDAMGKRE